MLAGRTRQVVSLAFIALLSACGGGGGGTPAATTATPATPPTSPAPATPAAPPSEPTPTAPAMTPLASASRLAARATFGLDMATLRAIARQGEEAWLEQQFKVPIGRHEPIVTELLNRKRAGEFAELEENNNNIEFVFRRLAWWQQAVYAPDYLRQRVAFALSEILVVSDKNDLLATYPYALSNYQDTLLTHAFGNYRDLLRAVTLHPAMGVYLSHVNNARANPELNTYPDENYAREVMQLFSIGLFELNPDGSEKIDSQGHPIPTYDNDDIREFARVFTGLSYGGDNARFHKRLPDFRHPMQMFGFFHDQDAKQLLGGTVLPAGQGGMQDIEDALDNLFNHTNAGPFIGRQLIQRLVTSNPSPAYVARVSAAFNGDTGSPRGDMKAVLRAILLDPEALATPGTYPDMGKLREPLLRALGLLKNFGVASPDGFYASTGYYLEDLLQQHPLSAPSVFNFFPPNHAPVGAIADAGLVAPEFQLTDSSSIVAVSNIVDIVLFRELVNDLFSPPFQRSRLNLRPYLALADDAAALLDTLDTLMTYDTLSEQTREAILATLEPIADPTFRVQTAIYLIFTAPEYAVQI